MDVEALLQSIPPLMVYLVVGAVVGIESLGIPFPARSCWSVPRCCRRTPSWPSTRSASAALR